MTMITKLTSPIEPPPAPILPLPAPGGSDAAKALLERVEERFDALEDQIDAFIRDSAEALPGELLTATFRPFEHMRSHVLQSGAAAVGIYVVMGLGLLLTAVLSGTIALPRSVLTILVVLAPVLTLALKDAIHWLATGQWSPPTEG